MPKLTVLQATQRILNSVNGEQITSISDTEEAGKVAITLRRCFRDLAAEHDLGNLGELVTLEDAANVDKPVLLRLPDAVSRVEWINYDNSLQEDPVIE